MAISQADAAQTVAEEIEDADAALGEALRTSAKLISRGVAAASSAQLHVLAVADAIAAETRVMAALGEAVSARKQTHEALHAVLDKLAIPTPKSGGGGGK